MVLLSLQQLNTDFAAFQEKVQDVDRRLATILCQGFDDCNCLASAVKVPVPPPRPDGACPGAQGIFACPHTHGGDAGGGPGPLR